MPGHHFRIIQSRILIRGAKTSRGLLQRALHLTTQSFRTSYREMGKSVAQGNPTRSALTQIRRRIASCRFGAYRGLGCEMKRLFIREAEAVNHEQLRRGTEWSNLLVTQGPMGQQ
ncbi:hypothetical protein D3C81_1810420 [compost metagenome]